jgi:hypothetical protein
MFYSDWIYCSCHYSKYRARFGLIPLNGNLLAIAGTISDQPMKTVECYSPEMNAWQVKNGVIKPRMNYSAAIVDNTLILIGGRQTALQNETNPWNTTEAYDADSDKWYFRKPMTTIRWGHVCGVMKVETELIKKIRANYFEQTREQSAEKIQGRRSI